MAFLKGIFKKKKQITSQLPKPSSQVMDDLKHLSTSVQDGDALQNIENIFGEDHDFVKREMIAFEHIPATVLYLNSITDKDAISKEVMKPLTESKACQLCNEPLKDYILKKYYFMQM